MILSIIQMTFSKQIVITYSRRQTKKPLPRIFPESGFLNLSK